MTTYWCIRIAGDLNSFARPPWRDRKFMCSGKHDLILHPRIPTSIQAYFDLASLSPSRSSMSLTVVTTMRSTQTYAKVVKCVLVMLV